MVRRTHTHLVVGDLRHTDVQSARRSIKLFALVVIGRAPSPENPFIMPRTEKLFPLHTHGQIKQSGKY